MKTLLAFAFTLYLFPLFAQDAARIKQLNGRSVSTKTLHERLTQLVDSARIAGLQVAVINDNKTVWTSDFGFKDIENQKHLNDSTIMYAASLTKPVSAYIFLRLVDKGIFSLDKPVHFYFKKPIGQYDKWKYLADDTVSFNRITPRMLLSHMARSFRSLTGEYQCYCFD